MPTFWVVENGKPAGPFSLEELKNRSIKPGTFIKSDTMDDYKEAHEIPAIRSLLGFKATIVQPQYFASLDVRLLAMAVDYLLVFGMYSVVALVLLSFANQQLVKIAIALSGIVIIPIARSVYAVFMECSKKQGTLGKQLLGIKVCDEEGSRISLGRSLLRNLGKWLSTLTFGLGYLFGFFDRKQQCLHDKLAGTLVVKERLL